MSEKIGIIVPTRCDRPAFEARCHQYIQEQTVKPHHVAWIGYIPKDEKVDLVSRVKVGLAECAMKGCTQVMIMENDDYYPEDYIQTMMIPKGKVASGASFLWYYHIMNQRFELMVHRATSALCTTAFRIDALRGFKWPAADFPFLDRPLWEFIVYTYGLEKVHAAYFDPYKPPFPVGIKHGMGMFAGGGHYGQLEFQDQNFEWLRKNISAPNSAFYERLSQKGA